MSQYFEENKNIKENKKIITLNFKNKEYNFITNNGMFSKDKVDYGSKLLLENITKEPLKGKILDLGCGYGTIGIIIASIFPDIKVDMCDITNRAIEITKENAKELSNIKVFKSNIYDNIDSKYNYIITNPPIRAGKETIRRFLFSAKDYLEDSGELWFVMRKDHGVKSIIQELSTTYQIEIKDKSKGFYIVICRQK